MARGRHGTADRVVQRFAASAEQVLAAWLSRGMGILYGLAETLGVTISMEQ